MSKQIENAKHDSIELSPKKDEEFLSNSIIQWNQKMKLRRRTLNLEDEEIHDE